VLTCRSLRPKSGRCEGWLAREMAASAFYRASSRSRGGEKPVSAGFRLRNSQVPKDF